MVESGDDTQRELRIERPGGLDLALYLIGTGIRCAVDSPGWKSKMENGSVAPGRVISSRPVQFGAFLAVHRERLFAFELFDMRGPVGAKGARPELDTCQRKRISDTVRAEVKTARAARSRGAGHQGRGDGAWRAGGHGNDFDRFERLIPQSSRCQQWRRICRAFRSGQRFRGYNFVRSRCLVRPMQ